MDNYSEQLVVRTRTRADVIKFAAISIGSILLATIFMFLAIVTMFYSLVIPAILVLFGGVWLVGQQSVEYEYIITNNELDIDKIIGRSKRKRMITIDLSATVDFGKYPPAEETEADATVHASSGLERDACYLIANHSSYGKVKVIFNPNEKTREAIMQELPSALRVKLRNNV